MVLGGVAPEVILWPPHVSPHPHVLSIFIRAPQHNLSLTLTRVLSQSMHLDKLYFLPSRIRDSPSVAPVFNRLAPSLELNTAEIYPLIVSVSQELESS